MKPGFMVIQNMAKISEYSWEEGEERDFKGVKTRVRSSWEWKVREKVLNGSRTFLMKSLLFSFLMFIIIIIKKKNQKKGGRFRGQW